jgi:hypothetical protein
LALASYEEIVGNWNLQKPPHYYQILKYRYISLSIALSCIYLILTLIFVKSLVGWTIMFIGLCLIIYCDFSETKPLKLWFSHIILFICVIYTHSLELFESSTTLPPFFPVFPRFPNIVFEGLLGAIVFFRILLSFQLIDAHRTWWGKKTPNSAYTKNILEKYIKINPNITNTLNFDHNLNLENSLNQWIRISLKPIIQLLLFISIGVIFLILSSYTLIYPINIEIYLFFPLILILLLILLYWIIFILKMVNRKLNK